MNLVVFQPVSHNALLLAYILHRDSELQLYCAHAQPLFSEELKLCTCIACSVRVLIMRRRQTFETPGMFAAYA